jgi:hypothetical protein
MNASSASAALLPSLAVYSHTVMAPLDVRGRTRQVVTGISMTGFIGSSTLAY